MVRIPPISAAVTPTQEQRARWLALLEKRGYSTFPNMPSFTFQMDKEQYLDLCATLTAEAVAAERSRVAEGAGMTDAEIMTLWKTSGDALGGDIVRFARSLIAEATARERERCARWQPIETHPDSPMPVLFYNAQQEAQELYVGKLEPYRDEWLTVGFWNGKTWCENGTGHEVFESWKADWMFPTHWMPLPDGPSAAAHRAGEGE